MTDPHDSAIHDLGAAVLEHLNTNGRDLCSSVEDCSASLLDWLDYLRASNATESANVLLDGTQGAVVETAGCVALGLVRPALAAIRSQIDMILSWLYFKDHAVEWAHLRETGRGFQLKSDVWKYLEEHHPKFRSRFRLLEQAKERRESDPYKLLSAHIHGQTDRSAPSVSALKNLVMGRDVCEECVALQSEVAEYIGDVLLAVYGDRWAGLPESARAPFDKRLGPKQRKAFFAVS